MRKVIAAVMELVLHRRHTLHQFMRFCVVGTINTGVDFVVYILLTRLSDFWMANLVYAAVLSYSCGAVSSFILNNFWTFRRDAGQLRGKVVKFLVVTAGGLLLNAAILHILVGLGVYDIIAKVFATVCVIAWNFTLFKYWAFKR
jgi:putative flippase GtrA